MMNSQRAPQASRGAYLPEIMLERHVELSRIGTGTRGDACARALLLVALPVRAAPALRLFGCGDGGRASGVIANSNGVKSAASAPNAAVS